MCVARDQRSSRITLQFPSATQRSPAVAARTPASNDSAGTGTHAGPQYKQSSSTCGHSISRASAAAKVDFPAPEVPMITTRMSSLIQRPRRRRQGRMRASCGSRQMIHLSAGRACRHSCVAVCCDGQRPRSQLRSGHVFSDAIARPPRRPPSPRCHPAATWHR